MAKFLILLFFPIACCAGTEGISVWVFDKTIHLPNNCTFAARPSVLDESNIRFVCESLEVSEKDDAWIWFRKYNAESIEGLKHTKSVRNFLSDNLGALSHYSFESQENEIKIKTELVCDEEICIQISGLLKSEVSDFVFVQLQ